MAQQMIQELERSAEIIMAPPNIVSSEQRHAAESVFLNFRKSKNPYNICREILEKSQNQYVMFEAAEVLKEALIREWAFLLNSDKVSLRQYLMQYITTRDNLPPYVRDRLLQVIAIMVKRASINDKGAERNEIMHEVENLVMHGDADKKILACNLILILMQEYSSTVKSSDVGIPWEVHFKAKREFEHTDLKRILSFCIYLLSEISQTDPPYPPNQGILNIMGYLLKITEAVLTWGYFSDRLPKRLIGVYESAYEADLSPALRLNLSWAEVVNAELPPMMFRIYWKVRDNDQLAHHALTCLVQLASLSGSILEDETIKSTYLNAYLVGLLHFLSSCTIKSKESLGISNLVRKLVLFFGNDISKLPDNMKDTFLDELARITCQFCEGAILEEAQNDEDKFYCDAFDVMLEVWASILLEENCGSVGGVVKDCSIRIFNKYLQCHLAPPDGMRPKFNDDTEEIEDTEDNDRTKYKDQLQTIGLFGRIIPGHALPILFKLLESGIVKLIALLERRTLNINEAESLQHIFEDLHWTILIAGHTLCMDSDGETPMIPSEIMRYSIEQTNSGNGSVEATLNTLMSVVIKGGQPQIAEQCDHVIRIVFNVFKLCVVEDFAISNKLGHLMSTEVGSTMMWFIKRWCLSYLLPVENYYQEISQTLIGTLGKDTESAKLVVGFVLSKIQSNMFYYQSEPILLRDTVDLFCDVVCVKQKSTHIVKTDSMRELIRFQQELRPGTLPPNILRGLCKGLCLAGAGLTSNIQEMNEYFTLILTPIQTQFRKLTSDPHFNLNYSKEEMQHIVIDLLECFIGIANGSTMPTVEILFQFLAPLLAELPAFINIYQGYQVIVQLILELFGQCAKNMLCYLNPLDSKKLYESGLATVQMYAKCNANRLSTEVFAEESSLQDLSRVLDLLTFILSKDCIDLCASSPNTGANEEAESITASDVSLFGLNFIMPLMTMDLLKYPNLCQQYYRLLVLINDIYPEKIINLPAGIQHTLLQSIELGLTNFGSDIVQTCLDFIQSMATYLFNEKLADSPFGQTMKPFLKRMMDLTLTHQINSDLTSAAGTAIYSLICCYPDEYRELVQSLIQMQTDPLIADRLAAAFNNLMMNVTLNCKRQAMLKFRDNFDKFIANVHGFLLIK